MEPKQEPCSRHASTGSGVRPADQRTLAAWVAVALVMIAGHGWWRGAHQGRSVDIDAAPPRVVRFTMDINRASWPELAQLPGLGENLARRVVASRQTDGPFQRPEDLQRVPGIGPKLIERIQPYLEPLGVR